MTLQYNGVMGEPDAVYVTWADGQLRPHESDCWGFISAQNLCDCNNRDRRDGLEQAVIPYRIRIYIKPNQPKRGG
jgi:hypothetical protein